ncbi:Mu transposase C-terminal domain-containing protein [Pseudomonas sp. B19125]|uniref:Mu transposase C-terminal domain-containing protein n=1 Tax=Pseudomonas sp. B19125 TaxID=3235109 RepID=UPI003783198D
MSEKIISAGLKILHDGQIWEVAAWLSSDMLQIKKSNREQKIISPDQIAEVIDQALLEKSLRVAEPDLASFSEKQLVDAERKYDALSRYLDGDPKLSSIETLALELGLSKSYVYVLLRKFCTGTLVSLVSEQRGRKRGTKLLRIEVEEIIKEAIDASSGAGSTVRAIGREVRERCENRKLPAPSIRAICLRIRDRPERETTKRIFGSKKAAQDHSVRGQKKLTSKPLELVQIDHCIVDVVIVDSVHRRPIGRPWLTIAIDIHTRSVLGFYLSLDHPSALSNALCMTHCISPKKLWLTELNLSHVIYPMFGLPKWIHVDNGKDFRSRAFAYGCKEYKIKLTFRPPGSPHHGAHIERYIGTLMRSMRGIIGSTLSSVADKKRYSNLKEPGMTFTELRDWLIEQIGIYHMTEHSQLNCSPLYKWEQSFKQTDEGFSPPALIIDRKKFFIDFLPYRSGTIQRCGVEINTIHYYSHTLKRYSIKKRCIIKFNPASIKNVWVKPEGDDEYIECAYADLSLPDSSLAEYKAARKNLSNRSRERIPPSVVFAAIQRNEQRVSSAARLTSKERRAQEKKRQKGNAPHKLEDATKCISKIDYSRPPKIYDVE